MNLLKILLLLTRLLFPGVRSSQENETDYETLPVGFKLGVSTSSYQIEGAWNASDKGLNVWDRYTHKIPSLIDDGSNGDVACDSYHKYKEDVKLLKDLGVDFYRFSLSWSRILPTGFPNEISRDGIQYYKNLLDELKAAGIEPLVTIYHWDHPAILDDMGGWTNEMMITWYADYARVVFEELGDRINMFVTINEPANACICSYDEPQQYPGVVGPDEIPLYLCMHNKLKAHAKVYHMYNEEYRSQNGKIGIALDCQNYYPRYENDTVTADVYWAFKCGWAVDPIFSVNGDYPREMKERIAENSRLEGYPRSRLPEFTQDEIDYIRGSADWIGLNHYTSSLTEPAPKSNTGLWYKDHGVLSTFDPDWPETPSPWLKVVPQGFGNVLRSFKTRYIDRPIYVLENGVSDDGSSLNDTQRVQYLHDYIKEMLIAVYRDGCNVRGYLVWSFLDSFEWNTGYGPRFGLVSVDFQHPDRPRTPKLSYSWFKRLIETRQLPPIDYQQQESPELVPCRTSRKN